MKTSHSAPIAFVAASSLAFALGTYLLMTRTAFSPQFFITACGEVLKNIQEHLHFNSDGVLSSLILFTTTIGVGLTLIQLVKFFISYWRLKQFRTEKILPKKLKTIINKHNLSDKSVRIIKDYNLTAYTIGLFKPKVIISKTLTEQLSSDQLEAVVLHEVHHLRSHHVLWLLLSRLISSLFFFIPLIKHLAQQLKTEFELSADAFVIKKQKTRNHLCDSLALNIQYAGEVFPHFATSPLEKRVEFLVDNKANLEKIGIRKLGISLLGFGLMVSMAVVQPNQAIANFASDSSIVCQAEAECQVTDCTNNQIEQLHNFTSLAPTDFSLSSSY
ncbi:MAG TPA: M56 family metallopeptidase [Patescibacteria group bacterium]|jgi:beta-lactamase regulating signal transducer with metallopeptidase domain